LLRHDVPFLLNVSLSSSKVTLLFGVRPNFPRTGVNHATFSLLDVSSSPLWSSATKAFSLGPRVADLFLQRPNPRPLDESRVLLRYDVFPQSLPVRSLASRLSLSPRNAFFPLDWCFIHFAPKRLGPPPSTPPPGHSFYETIVCQYG